MAQIEQYDVNGNPTGVFLDDSDGSYYLDDGTPLLEYYSDTGQYVEETDPNTLYNADGSVADNNYNAPDTSGQPVNSNGQPVTIVSASPSTTGTDTSLGGLIKTAGVDILNMLGKSNTTPTTAGSTVVTQQKGSSGSTMLIVIGVLILGAIGTIVFIKVRKHKTK